MDEIRKKIKEINDWADVDSRATLIFAKDGEDQITSVNASVKEATNMLICAMDEDRDIERIVILAAMSFLIKQTHSKIDRYPHIPVPCGSQAERSASGNKTR